MTWDEVECIQQNSQIKMYRFQYNIVGKSDAIMLLNFVSERKVGTSLQMDVNNRIIIPDLNQRYEFLVHAIGTGGSRFSIPSDILEVIPANLGKSTDIETE